jgi:hypothetical protein
VPAEKLVGKSFEFLLERESNTSILRSFDLPVIQRYFPEYEQTIRTMLKLRFPEDFSTENQPNPRPLPKRSCFSESFTITSHAISQPIDEPAPQSQADTVKNVVSYLRWRYHSEFIVVGTWLGKGDISWQRISRLSRSPTKAYAKSRTRPSALKRSRK